MRKLANEEGATRKASVEGLLVYSTLPKVRAARAVVARQAERAVQERKIREFGNEEIRK